MRNFRILAAGLAVLALTTPTLADPISMALGCQDGTRNEPQAPTITPAWTEDVPDIYHEAWIEDVPDIQHDGWVEVTPDILHEAYVEVTPDIEHPETVKHETIPGSTKWNNVAADICIRPRSLFFNKPARDYAYRADCLTPREHGGMANGDGGGGRKIVIAGWTEDVPDIEHPAWTEDVPDIQHEDYVEVTPDIEHPAWTEVTPDIVHPEIVTENPDLVINTKTIKYKEIKPISRPPFFEVTFRYETTDGTCH